MPPRARMFRTPLLVIAGIVASTTSSQAWTVDGVPVCVALGNQFGHAAVADGAGGVIIAWTDQRAAQPAVYLLRVGPGGGCSPGWPQDGLTVTSQSAGQSDPAVVSDGAGGAIVAWVDLRNAANTGADIYAQHIAADGTIAQGWPVDGLVLCQAPGRQGPPVSCGDGAGGACLVWEDERGADIDLYTQHVLDTGALG